MTRAWLLAGCLASTGTLAAADTPLPLEAPAGAQSLIADFVAVCSRAVTNAGEASDEALRRGWSPDTQSNSVVLGMFAGLVAFRKEFGEGEMRLVMNRSTYPHVIAQSCYLTTGDFDPDLELSAITEIEGVEGFGAVIDESPVGLWSLIDGDGEIVTISASGARTYLSLAMSRVIETGLGRSP